MSRRCWRLGLWAARGIAVGLLLAGVAGTALAAGGANDAEAGSCAVEELAPPTAAQVPVDVAIARLQADITYLGSQLKISQITYRARLTDALSRQGLDDAEQALALDGEGWVTTMSVAPAGQLTFFARKAEDDFYNLNLGPLYKSVMALRTSPSGTTVPAEALNDVDRRMALLRAFEVTLDGLRERAVDIEARQSAFEVRLLAAEEADDFVMLSVSPEGEIGSNLIWQATPEQLARAADISAQLAQFKGEADALAVVYRGIPMQFTSVLGESGPIPACPAATEEPEVPPGLQPD
ncbi:MAG: hypothetical protein ACTHNL_06495 [Devosia sp.]